MGRADDARRLPPGQAGNPDVDVRPRRERCDAARRGRTMSDFRPDTVSGRLVAFMRQRIEQGLPDVVRHEAKRLLLNQLKASIGATDHAAVTLLLEWATEEAQGGTGAHVHWFGTDLPPALA